MKAKIYYDDIVEVEPSYESPNGTKYFFSYIVTTKNGKQIDLFDYRMKDVIFVHNQLLKRQTPMRFASIDALTYENMKVRCKADELKMVEKCFLLKNMGKVK